MIDHYFIKNICLQRFQEHAYIRYPLSKNSAPFKSKNQNALKEKPEKIAPIIELIKNRLLQRVFLKDPREAGARRHLQTTAVYSGY